MDVAYRSIIVENLTIEAQRRAQNFHAIALQDQENLHRKDAKDAKKSKNKKEDAVFYNKICFSFSLLCALCVFAVQIF
jgi:hypothetical protein